MDNATAIDNNILRALYPYTDKVRPLSTTRPRPLLICALHARLALVLVHHVVRIGTLALPLVDLLQLDLLQVDAWRELLDRVAWWERLLEEGDDRGVDVVGELDGYPDEQVARLVVSLRRHALPADDLEVVYMGCV